MNIRNKIVLEIVVFLGLTALLSTLAYLPISQSGTISGTGSKLASLLMLAPGLAAILTYLIFERSLRPIGWKPGKIRYLILGLIIPMIYCSLEYGFVWMIGRGIYNGKFPPNLAVYLVIMLFNGTLSAALEEIGWRGLLVPKMIHLTGFANTALISGLIWAVWHYPLIIFTNVRLGNTPLVYSLVCFTVFVIGMSFAAAWLRLKSGSLWTACLLHGSHNVFMLYIFNILTTDTGQTWLWLGEYGAATAVVGLVLVVVFMWLWGEIKAQTKSLSVH
jgi:membrane protease YdiL (CAAX protease family)